MTAWIIILGIIIVILAVRLIVEMVRHKDTDKAMSIMLAEKAKLMVELIEAKADIDTDWKERYEALEQGADEQQENYEQMYLSLLEQVTSLNDQLERRAEAADEFYKIAEGHADHCIPQFARGLTSVQYEWMNAYSDSGEKYAEQYAWAVSRE